MTETAALEPRVVALEELLNRIQGDLGDARMLAASANLNAVSARGALRSVKGELEGCRQMLLDLVSGLGTDEARRVEFVVTRLDRSLRAIALNG